MLRKISLNFYRKVRPGHTLVLWFNKNAHKTDTIHYCFCQLSFGLNLSAAILNSNIQKHLTFHSQSHQHVSKFLVNSFMMTIFGGAASVQEGEEIYNVSRRIMKEEARLPFKEMIH